MKKPTPITNLQGLGLNAYEAKAYLALLERNTLTATEVANLGGIPRARVYETLQTLMGKGLCVLRPGRFKTYGATNPTALKEALLPGTQRKIDTELGTLQEEQRKLILKKKEMSSDADSLVNHLLPVYEKGSSDYSALEYIEIIKDPYQIHKRYMQLCKEAKQEVLNFTKRPLTGPRRRVQEQVAHQVELMTGHQGVIWRTIYEIPTDADERAWALEHIDLLVRGGEKAKVIEELPLKMVIFDSRIVMFLMQDPVSEQTSVTTQVVEHHDLARALTILFETLWGQAQDYHILRD